MKSDEERVKELKEKGELGENIVFNQCFKAIMKGGLLYHSLEIPMDSNLPGNIKKEFGSNHITPVAPNTEIDVLLVTLYNVFVIEVKTYRANSITLTTSGMSGAANNEKSPIHQNEMHCRHIYPLIYQALPNGDITYIKPLVVFADKCTIKDNRSQYEKNYIPIANLNTLANTIKSLDVKNQFRLDLQNIKNILSKFKYKKFEEIQP